MATTETYVGATVLRKEDPELLTGQASYVDNQTMPLTSSSMTQYLVPGATEIPSIELDRTETPSTTNPLGVKEIGEAGTIAAPPAVVNPVVDALSYLGVTDAGKPTTPERGWRAIQRAKGGAA